MFPMNPLPHTGEGGASGYNIADAYDQAYAGGDHHVPTVLGTVVIVAAAGLIVLRLGGFEFVGEIKAGR